MSQLWQWQIPSFRDALWTLELTLVVPEAIERDLDSHWSTLYPAVQNNSAAALKCKNLFINKSKPITIKLLSVLKIIIKIKELIYPEDFKWYLLK